MFCYNHNKENAAGICKECHKAICHDCIELVGGNVACKDTCIEYIMELNQLNEKAKKIYNIGTSASNKSPWKNLGVLTYFIMGLGFVFIELLNYFAREDIHPSGIFLGSLFLLIGVIAYYKAKKLNLDC